MFREMDGWGGMGRVVCVIFSILNVYMLHVCVSSSLSPFKRQNFRFIVLFILFWNEKPVLFLPLSRFFFSSQCVFVFSLILCITHQPLLNQPFNYSIYTRKKKSIITFFSFFAAAAILIFLLLLLLMIFSHISMLQLEKIMMVMTTRRARIWPDQIKRINKIK